jgi:hypothetical protein
VPPACPRTLSSLVHRLRSEVGEGVISTAIAVLIMAFIGVAMWVAFSTIFDGAASNTGELVEQIGE